MEVPHSTDPLRDLARMPPTTEERISLLLQVAQKFLISQAEEEEPIPFASIIRNCRRYCTDTLMEVRAVAYRTIRLGLRSPSDVRILFDHGINVFLVRSLARDNKHELEREQALKLIRVCMDFGPTATKHLPSGVVRAILAMAEHADDPFHNLCVETLCELAIRDPELVVESGGIRVMLHVLVEGPQEMSDAVSLTLLYLLDRPTSRQFMRPGVDIEVLTAPLTNGTLKGIAGEERARHCTLALRPYLTSWIGLSYLCMDNRRTIKSLVMALRTGPQLVQIAILELISHILDYPVGDTARPMPTEGRAPAGFAMRPRRIRPSFADRVDLLDHHMSALLSVLVECDLLEALSLIVEKNDDAVVPLCCRAISRILRLSHTILPTARAARIQALPRLVSMATAFKDETTRHHATATLMYVDEAVSLAEGSAFRLGRGLGDSVTRALSTAHRPPDFGDVDDGFPSRASFSKGMRPPVAPGMGVSASAAPSVPSHSHGYSSHNPISSFSPHTNPTAYSSATAILLHRDSSPDEGRVRQMIQETYVLSENDYTRWDWDLVSELFHTALRNPSCLADTIRTCQFLKRVLGFYRPATGSFPDLLLNAANLRFLQIGCDVIGLLAASVEGVKYLHETLIIREMSDFLGTLLLEEGDSAEVGAGPALTDDRLRRSLAWGYFWILMSASKTKEGLRLLEKSNTFDILFRLADLDGFEQVRREILLSMDYRLDGYPRIVLAKMIASATEDTRRLALTQLRYLAHMRTPGFRDWGVRLLVESLYDISPEVCHLAITALDEACAFPEYLEGLVRLRPVLEHLGSDAARPLFLRLLSSQYGFEFLLETEYVHEELESWVMGLNEAYVAAIEVSMAKATSSPYYAEEQLDLPIPKAGAGAGAGSGAMERYCHMPTFHTDGISPPHMYGALASTSPGCRVLRERGRLPQLLASLQEHIAKEGIVKSRIPQGLRLYLDMEADRGWGGKSRTRQVETEVEPIVMARIRRVKAALWALGNVGTTEEGWKVLEEMESQAGIVETFLEILERSPILSIRGTAFHALGLLAKTVPGMESLKEHGWECAGPEAIRWWWFWKEEYSAEPNQPTSISTAALYTRSASHPESSSTTTASMRAGDRGGPGKGGDGTMRTRPREGTMPTGWEPGERVKLSRQCSGLCLPIRQNSHIFTLDTWTHTLANRPSVRSARWARPVDPTDDALLAELLGAASSMGNHILANAGTKTLVRLRTENPEYFSRIDVWLRLEAMLEVHNFRLSARRFLLDLFEVAFDSPLAFDLLDEGPEEEEAPVEENGGAEDRMMEMDEDGMVNAVEWGPDEHSVPSSVIAASNLLPPLPRGAPSMVPTTAKSSHRFPATAHPHPASRTPGGPETILPTQVLEPGIRIIGGFPPAPHTLLVPQDF